MEDLRPWLRRLVSDNADEQRDAGQAVFGIASSCEPSDSTDFPPTVFATAVQTALAELDAVPILTRLLEREDQFWDRDHERRMEGHQASSFDYLHHFGIHAVLASMGPAGRGVIGQVLAMLGHREPVIRDLAIQAIGSIGAEARSALPTLLGKVAPRGKDCYPFKLGRAVALISGNDAECLREVLALLDLSRTNLEMQAGMGILSEMGARAESAVPAVLRLTDAARDAETRSNAAGTLGAIAQRSAPALLSQIIDRLIKMTRAPEWFIRGNAVRALGALSRSGQRLPEIVEAILPSIGDREGDDWNAHEAAVTALESVGSAALPLLEVMVERKGKHHGEIRKIIRKIRSP